MDRRSKIIIGIFFAVLLGIIVTEIVRPKPINWTPSYTLTDKIPFGCYVLFNELPQLFPDQELIAVQQNTYEELIGRDTLETSRYIFINDGIYFDEQESHQLLNYVHRGNEVFMASSYFSGILADTLNLDVRSVYTVQEDTVKLSFTNPAFAEQTYIYTRGLYKSHFSSVDSLNTTILGYLDYKQETPAGGFGDALDTPPKGPKANFIKINFGQGVFYLNTTPQAFANYYMLNDNQDYVANSLSYLKTAPVMLWDNYKKSGRIVIDSPMRFVLNQVSLRWVYYLTMIGLIIFVIFRAKREQRIIPVIPPLQNSSIAFAKTVGSLYYQHKDFTDLIGKKINYFLAYLRSHYFINTAHLNEKTARDLAIKSGRSVEEAKSLLDFIIHIKQKKTHSQEDLIVLNKKIEPFKEKPYGRTGK